MSPSRSSTHSAGCWFLQSGIQDASGGVARYYHSDIQRNARVSTEITGYSVSTLVYLYEKTGDTAFREAAIRAGQFLTRKAWTRSLASFPFEYSESGEPPEPVSYFFDTGIVIRGLLALGRMTRDSEYTDIAIRAGRSLASDFEAGDRFHPAISLPGKHALSWTSRWSRSPGCYQLKSALAWHDLYRQTKDPQFLDCYERALRTSLQMKDDFLPGKTDEQTMDRLHAYAYFLEGTLPFADRTSVKQALAEGIERISGLLRQISAVFERSDVYAQLLRVRVFADQLAGVPLDRTQAEVEAERIPEFQFQHTDLRIRGGFWFGRKGLELLPFVNPVSTAFCLQALDMWQSYLAGETLDPHSLI